VCGVQGPVVKEVEVPNEVEFYLHVLDKENALDLTLHVQVSTIGSISQSQMSIVNSSNVPVGFL